MLRKILIIIVIVLATSGCTKKEITTDPTTIPEDKEQNTVEERVVISEVLDEHSFEIRSIESLITSINDKALEDPLNGVAYHVMLISDEKIPIDKISSFEFEVVSKLPHDAVISPEPQGITFLSNTTDGYIYSLRFDTIYRDYSKQELADLNAYRDFHVYVKYEGGRERINPI